MRGHLESRTVPIADSGRVCAGRLERLGYGADGVVAHVYGRKLVAESVVGVVPSGYLF